MSKYLISTVEIYRADSEDEANILIDEAKKEGVLTKYSCDYKEKKTKGEIVDSWYKVTLTKNFTDEKEPDQSVIIKYEV